GRWKWSYNIAILIRTSDPLNGERKFFMNGFWDHVIIETAARYSVVVLCSVVFLAIFELVTSYKNWVEIKNGNLAVAMATGGKLFGIATIFRYYIVLVGVCLDLYCYYSVILFLNFLHRILKLMKKSETGIKQLALFRWSFQLDYHTSSVRI